MEFTGERYIPTEYGEIRFEHLHRYLLSQQFVKGKIVLDLASGEGYGSHILAQTAVKVIGVDIDEETINFARGNYKAQPNLEFLVGSCSLVPLAAQSVDMVTSFETIEHHDQHEEMMLEIKRVLRPGGSLIISSPDRLNYSDKPNYTNPYHVKELYYEELLALLQKYFQNIKIYGQRLATASFVFTLDDFFTSVNYRVFSESGEGQIQNLQDPLYLVALCSDDALISNLDSIYIDNTSDLYIETVKQLKKQAQTLKNQQIEFEEKVQFTQQLQEQLEQARTEQSNLLELSATSQTNFDEKIKHVQLLQTQVRELQMQVENMGTQISELVQHSQKTLRSKDYQIALLQEQLIGLAKKS
jgi:ubiquinone/menaquinone biosynthesis C-methylase UbiE